jgi:hypothetical protein
MIKATNRSQKYRIIRPKRYDTMKIIQHLQNAYDLLVIIIGLAAFPWDLLGVQDERIRFAQFCILYGLFTLFRGILLLKKYYYLCTFGIRPRAKPNNWYLPVSAHNPNLH